MSYDKTIFKNKTLGDIFEDIYTNSRETKRQSDEVVQELINKVETLKDSLMVVPVIKDFLELGVKNDDLLIKMANIIQRVEASQNKGEELIGDLMDDPDVQMLIAKSEKANKGKK
jgi:hypothetical protein